MGFCLSYFLHSDVSYCVVPILMKLVLPFLLSAMDSICCDEVASIDIVMFIFPSW